MILIHADDFGLSPDVNQGVLAAMQAKIVGSASLLVNFPAAMAAAELAHRHQLDIGWHLNLVQGRPLTEPQNIASLVDSRGEFLSAGAFMSRCFLRRLKPEHLRLELQAQLNFFSEHGLKPSHVDGHLHMHAMPVVAEVLRDLLGEQPIPFVRCPRDAAGWRAPRRVLRHFLARLPGSRPDFWRGTGAQSLEFHGIALAAASHRLSAWRQTFEQIRRDPAEIMVHPAAVGEACDRSLYGALDRRTEELNLLLSPEFKNLLADQGLVPTSYRVLSQG